jgi:hypothetical protein
MKEKLILTIIVVISSLTIAMATGTLKNCGNSALDQFATDTGFRIDMDNTVGKTCEYDFASPPPNGWWTGCWLSHPSEVKYQYTDNSIIISAIGNSLAGYHLYGACDASTGNTTTQDR